MAAASFSLTAAVQDTFQVSGPVQQQADPTVTPVNANQAQGATAPADTVTLTSQAAESQQTGSDTNRGYFERAAFLGAAEAYIGTNAANSNRQAPEPTLPVLLPQSQNEVPPAPAANTAANTAAATQSAAADTADAAATTANPAAATAPAAAGTANTPEQQLQQLDQSLQQLGINPESIPLFNRMAMLLYANDPAALRLLVQTVQGAAAQQGAATQQGSAPIANATGAANQNAVQVLLPAGAPANQTQPAAQVANPPSITLTAQPGALPAQIQELQIAFQTVETQQGSQHLNGSSAPPPVGTSLNVTA